MLRGVLSLLVVSLMLGTVAAAEVSLQEIRAARKIKVQRKRKLVVHSDGYPMNDRNRGQFEPSAPPSLFPRLVGTQTSTCTYSLVHQFPVARLYRSKVAVEWPPGIIKKMYGKGPDGLDQYIQLCRRRGHEAFWAMRMNDTHDASGSAHGLKRWNSNSWKKQNTSLLFATRNTPLRYGRWSAVDYGQPKVREKVLQLLQEVCHNYAIDGLLLDFFRHLPTFKTTGLGGIATDKERAALTGLFRRIRQMADQEGARRGRPILIAIRAPDTLEYSKALGLDIDRWLKEGLIDIWLATGYFRLGEWSAVVRLGHQHDVQVWASMSDSRIVQRDGRNSLEIYRGRIANAWHAGVDAVFLFNFFYKKTDPQFKLLSEAGHPKTLAGKDKVFVAEARGRYRAGHFLIYGDRYFRRPVTVSPNNPVKLSAERASFVVPLHVADDFSTNRPKRVILNVQVRKPAERVQVKLNGRTLTSPTNQGRWRSFAVAHPFVRRGVNQVSLIRPANTASSTVTDVQLRVNY